MNSIQWIDHCRVEHNKQIIMIIFVLTFFVMDRDQSKKVMMSMLGLASESDSSYSDSVEEISGPATTADQSDNKSTEYVSATSTCQSDGSSVEEITGMPQDLTGTQKLLVTRNQYPNSYSRILALWDKLY